jgi:hypothetical protein
VNQRETTLFKICLCSRPFNPFTGHTLRIDLEEYMPDWVVRSSQPCIKCDKDFYVKKAMDLIEKERGGEHELD